MSKISTCASQIQTPSLGLDGNTPVAWLAPIDGKGDSIPLKCGANKLGRGQTPLMHWQADRRISRNLGVLHVIMDSKRPLFVLTVLSKVFITQKNQVKNTRSKEIKGMAVCEIDLGDTISFLRTSHIYCLVCDPINDDNDTTQHDGDPSVNSTPATAAGTITTSSSISAATSIVNAVSVGTKNKEALLPPRKRIRTSFQQRTELFAMGMITAGKVHKWARILVRLATTEAHHLACDSQPALMLTRLLRIVEHLAKAAPNTGGLKAFADLGVLDALYSLLVNSMCSWPPGWRVSPEQLPILIAARPAYQRFKAVYPSTRDGASVSPPLQSPGLGTVRYGDRLADINLDGSGVTDPCGGAFDGVLSWMVTMGPRMTASESAIGPVSQQSIRVLEEMSHVAPSSNVPKSKSLQYGEFDFFSLACVLHTCMSKLIPADVHGRQLTMVDLGSGSGKVVVAAALLWPRLLSRVIGIEVLPHLHAQAATAAGSHKQLKAPTLTQPSAEVGNRHLVQASHQVMRFYCGDFLDRDGVGPSKWRWWEGGEVDLVVAHSTCFSRDLMCRIAQRCLCLRPGSIVVTTSAPLHIFIPKQGANAFELIRGDEFWMPWGTATVFVQQRR